MSERDLAKHEAHERPLADRLVNRAVRDWLETATALALAGAGDLNDHERGMRAGIEQMRHLHLSGWEYSVVPDILDQLRRAGLLVERPPA